MPLTALRELTLPTQKALTSRDQKTFLVRSNYSIEVGTTVEPRIDEIETARLFAYFLGVCGMKCEFVFSYTYTHLSWCRGAGGAGRRAAPPEMP
eukprot:5814822-Prymnesium_polylepis.1